MSNTENRIAKILKYLSMKYRIGSPNFHMSAPNNKNLEVLLTSDAIKNILKFISKAPAETVKTLNGIGVKPDTKTIQKFHSSYFNFIS